jgi:hypothetical protein
VEDHVGIGHQRVDRTAIKNGALDESDVGHGVMQVGQVSGGEIVQDHYIVSEFDESVDEM